VPFRPSGDARRSFRPDRLGVGKSAKNYTDKYGRSGAVPLTAGENDETSSAGGVRRAGRQGLGADLHPPRRQECGQLPGRRPGPAVVNGASTAEPCLRATGPAPTRQSNTPRAAPGSNELCFEDRGGGGLPARSEAANVVENNRTSRSEHELTIKTTEVNSGEDESLTSPGQPQGRWDGDETHRSRASAPSRTGDETPTSAQVHPFDGRQLTPQVTRPGDEATGR